MKNKEIVIRVSEKDKKQIFLDAKKEGRSVSNYLLWLWEQSREAGGNYVSKIRKDKA